MATYPSIDKSAQEAVQWAVQMRSGVMSDIERIALDQWLATSAANREAWERLSDSLRLLLPPTGVDRVAARRALLVKDPSRRRFVLASVAAVAAAGTGTWLFRSGMDNLGEPVSGTLLKTALGERRTYPLSDGAVLMLNAKSVVEENTGGTTRMLVLRTGSLYLDTKQLADSAAPLAVRTRDGFLQTAGGAFGVSLVRAGTQIEVTREFADVRTVGGNHKRLKSGESATFDRNTIWLDSSHGTSYTSWTQGVFVASNTPLGDVIDALQPYTAGMLSITDDAARHRVSGVFHLDHPDQAIRQIEETLDVKVQRFTPYVTVIST